MIGRLRFRSLTTRLAFWFLAVTMLSLAATVTILYFERAAVIRNQEFETLQVVRDLKIKTLSNWLEERMSDLEVLTQDRDLRSPDIERIMLRETGDWSQQDRETADIARQHLQSYEKAYLAYNDISIISATSGRTAIGSNPTHEGQDKKRDPHFTEPVRTKKPFIRDIYHSKTIGRPSMAFSAPIFCHEHRGEHLIGVVVAQADLEHVLYPLLQEHIGEGKTGETLIVNKDGIALNELRWYKNAPLKLKITAEPARESAAGKTGIVETKDYRGEMVLAAYAHIPLMKWGFVAKRDLSEIYAPIRSMLREMIYIFAAIFVIVLLLSMLLAATISQPVRGIEKTVRLFAEGDMDARFKGEGSDEVGSLGKSFNNMARILASQVNVTQAISDITAAAGQHNNLSNLLEEILPLLMETTRSQLGVVYLTDDAGNNLDQMLVHGIDGDKLTRRIAINPPDHLLAASMASEKTQILKDIPTGNELLINTHAGKTTPRALLSIPLILGKTHVGVIGLASLYDYDSTAEQIADGIEMNLAQAVEICRAFSKSEEMRERINERNRELRVTNEQLQSTSEELNTTANEQKELIRELEVQKQQVGEADRLKSEFLSNMSHELRTPLNSVLSLSQLMLSNGIGKKEGEDKERLEIIERNGRHLLNLINNILDLSKIESGKMELFVSTFDSKELVESIVAAIRPMAKQKNLSVNVENPKLENLRTDRDKLRQILLNLMSNAVKFTDKGEIGIEVKQAWESVVFKVWDTGCGIPENGLPYIFDEFRQVDGSTTRQYGGTGLGLAISQRLTSLLGGNIHVESEEGKGATFTVTLPMVAKETLNGNNPTQNDGGRLRNVQPKRPKSDPPVSPRILVVEDNEVAAEQIATALTTDGFVVDVAGDGEAALAIVKKHLPDGIVLDLMMPKIDGFQVLNAIRSTPETAHLPVLVLTAKDLTPKERRELASNNVRQLIQKGQVNREQLVESVRLLVGIHDDEVQETGSAVISSPRVILPKGGRATILVVEDNPDNMKVTKDILGGMDIDLIEARDGKEALETAKSKQPDIIVMDMNLPVMSGLEATDKIRQDKQLKNIVIIALTAKAMMGDKEKIISAGCDDYLSKPVEPGKLRAAIGKWLEGEGA